MNEKKKQIVTKAPEIGQTERKQPLQDPVKVITESLLKGTFVLRYNTGKKTSTSTVVLGQDEIFPTILFSDDKQVKTVPKQIFSSMGSGITEGGIQTIERLFTYNPAQPEREEAKIGALIALMKYKAIIQEGEEYSYTDGTSAPSGIIKKHAEAGKILHTYLDYYLERSQSNTLSERDRAFLESEHSFLSVFLEYQRRARNIQADISGLRPDIQEDFIKAQETNSIPILPIIQRTEGSRRSSNIFKEERELERLINLVSAHYSEAHAAVSLLSIYEDDMTVESQERLSVAEVAKQLGTQHTYSDSFIYFATGWHLHMTMEKFVRTMNEYIDIVQAKQPLTESEMKELSEMIGNFCALDPFDTVPENFPSFSEIRNLPLPLTPETEDMLAPIFSVPEYSDVPEIRLFYLQLALPFQYDVIKSFKRKPLLPGLPPHVLSLFEDVSLRLQAYVEKRSMEEQSHKSTNLDNSYIPIIEISNIVANNGSDILPKVLKSALTHITNFPIEDSVVQALCEAAETNFLERTKRHPIPTNDSKRRNPYNILSNTEEGKADAYLDTIKTFYSQESQEVSDKGLVTFSKNFYSIFTHLKARGILTIQNVAGIGDIDMAVRKDKEFIEIFLISPDNNTELALQVKNKEILLTFPYVFNWNLKFILLLFDLITKNLPQGLIQNEATESKAESGKPSIELPTILIGNPEKKKEIITRHEKVKTRPTQQAPTIPSQPESEQGKQKIVTVILPDRLLKGSKIPDQVQDNIKKTISFVEQEGLKPPRVKPYPILAKDVYRIRVGKYRLRIENVAPGVFQVTKIVNKKDIDTQKKLQNFVFY